ncbi:unnamed protein product [Musa acuminata var. zebrina]
MWVCMGARQGFWSGTCATCRSRQGVLRLRREAEMMPTTMEDGDCLCLWAYGFGSHFIARHLCFGLFLCFLRVMEFIASAQRNLSAVRPSNPPKEEFLPSYLGGARLWH